MNINDELCTFEGNATQDHSHSTSSNDQMENVGAIVHISCMIVLGGSSSSRQIS